jgi:hypothetical protein
MGTDWLSRAGDHLRVCAAEKIDLRSFSKQLGRSGKLKASKFIPTEPCLFGFKNARRRQ